MARILGKVFVKQNYRDCQAYYGKVWKIVLKSNYSCPPLFLSRGARGDRDFDRVLLTTDLNAWFFVKNCKLLRVLYASDIFLRISMKQLLIAERFCLIAHVLSMAFGLAGLLIVLPRPELVMSLSPAGQTLFQWGMAGGGVVYIIFGAAAVALYAFRTLGLGATLTFLLPSVFLSLSSELLGT
jgi:Predicted membrane protein